MTRTKIALITKSVFVITLSILATTALAQNSVNHCFESIRSSLQDSNAFKYDSGSWASFQESVRRVYESQDSDGFSISALLPSSAGPLPINFTNEEALSLSQMLIEKRDSFNFSRADIATASKVFSGQALQALNICAEMADQGLRANFDIDGTGRTFELSITYLTPDRNSRPEITYVELVEGLETSTHCSGELWDETPPRVDSPIKLDQSYTIVCRRAVREEPFEIPGYPTLVVSDTMRLSISTTSGSIPIYLDPIRYQGAVNELEKLHVIVNNLRPDVHENEDSTCEVYKARDTQVCWGISEDQTLSENEKKIEGIFPHAFRETPTITSDVIFTAGNGSDTPLLISSSLTNVSFSFNYWESNPIDINKKLSDTDVKLHWVARGAPAN